MPIGLSLNGIVDVNVSVDPNMVYRKSFDTALILGESLVISASDRIKAYLSLDDVLAAGFTSGTPEYKACALYFAQNSKPYRVFIGVKAVGESLVEAATACRNANPEWYVLIPTDALILNASEEELEALAGYIESAKPETLLALSLVSPDYLTTLGALKTAGYQRTIAQYDNPTANAANDGISCIAGIMGFAMGKNKAANNSFNLAYKKITGLKPMMFTESTALNSLLSANGNVYLNQGYFYDIFRQGKMANGYYFDEVINLDMLVNNLRSSVMQKLTGNDKIPQTENGVNILIAAISEAIDPFVSSGFIAQGTWLGSDILNLKTGDTLSNGYLIQFESILSQPIQDRLDRVAPACYVAIKLAGAIEHVVIGVNVSK